jgi:hypothetical protein
MEETLRICIIASLFAPSVGGAQTRAEKQARVLQALGHDVTIVTLRNQRWWKREEILDGLPIVRVGEIYNRQGMLRVCWQAWASPGWYSDVPDPVALASPLRCASCQPIWHSCCGISTPWQDYT